MGQATTRPTRRRGRRMRKLWRQGTADAPSPLKVWARACKAGNTGEAGDLAKLWLHGKRSA